MGKGPGALPGLSPCDSRPRRPMLSPHRLPLLLVLFLFPPGEKVTEGASDVINQTCCIGKQGLV